MFLATSVVQDAGTIVRAPEDAPRNNPPFGTSGGLSTRDSKDAYHCITTKSARPLGSNDAEWNGSIFLGLAWVGVRWSKLGAHGWGTGVLVVSPLDKRRGPRGSYLAKKSFSLYVFYDIFAQINFSKIFCKCI